jgi:hypothetical protein
VIEALLLGSVGETLIHEGQTPVCIVPPLNVEAAPPGLVSRQTPERL